MVSNFLALAALLCLFGHVVGTSLGENDIKRVQSALKTALVAPAAVVESNPNLRIEAKTYNLIRTSFFSDSACTVAGDVPFLCKF